MRYWILFMTSFFLFMGEQSIAQSASLPVAGYDTTQYHPLFIQSPDGQFKLNIGMYTQFRYNMNWRAGVPDTVQGFTRGYNLARTRIFLEGDLTEKLYYHFRFNINPSGNIELFVAYLQLNFAKKWNVRIGKQFMALGREDWIYAADLASIDFSANDFTYAIWTSFGVQFRNVPNKYMRYWLGVSNGAYGGRKSFPSPTDSDVLLTGRFEWNTHGVEWDDWDDMLGRKGRKFGMLVGVGLGHLMRYDEIAILKDAERASQLNVDFTASGNGFQFFSQVTATSFNYKDGVQKDHTQFGGYSTLGYWINEHWMPFGRLDYVSAGGKEGTYEDYLSPGIGISYYPFNWTNRIRFTGEYNFLAATLNNTVVQPDGQLGLVQSSYGSQQSVRFQLQFGF